MTHRSPIRELHRCQVFVFVIAVALCMQLVAQVPTAQSAQAPIDSTNTPIPFSSPTSEAPLPTLSPYEDRYLAQQDQSLKITFAALIVTVLVTIGGWTITYLQQKTFVKQQEQSSARLQRSLARLQAELERERALATSKLERLKELAKYLEFPNRMSQKQDADELRRRYDTEWNDDFGYYFQLAVRFDDSTPGQTLVSLLEEMDHHIDAWIIDVMNGEESNTEPSHLAHAMHLSRCALDRLDEIEARLVMGKTRDDVDWTTTSV